MPCNFANYDVAVYWIIYFFCCNSLNNVRMNSSTITLFYEMIVRTQKEN